MKCSTSTHFLSSLAARNIRQFTPPIRPLIQTATRPCLSTSAKPLTVLSKQGSETPRWSSHVHFWNLREVSGPVVLCHTIRKYFSCSVPCTIPIMDVRSLCRVLLGYEPVLRVVRALLMIDGHRVTCRSPIMTWIHQNHSRSNLSK